LKKILFIQPPLEANFKHKKIMPLGIGYLLAVIRREFPEYELKFLDMESGNIRVSDAEKHISNFCPDILMISYWTAMADYAFEIMTAARKKLGENLIIIAGGVHPSIYPEESLKYADYVVKFEGEITLTELLKRIETGGDLSSVKGITYNRNGEFYYTGDRDFIENLDTLPFPEWNLMPMENYDTQMHLTGGRRMPVMGSRGCPYACSYCVSPYHWKRKLRWRSVKNVVDEIEEIIKRLNISKIHFWDDNLFLKKDYIGDLCNEIITRGLKIEWLGLTRASHIANCEDLIPLIKKSGCIGMEMGIETADPNSHKAINKDENLDITMKAAVILKKHGLSPMFTYMALNPGDTLNTYYNQAVFIDKILEGCGWINFFHPLPVPLYIGQLCAPHPGTKLFDDAKNLGIVNARKWTDYYHHRVNFIPDSLLDDVPVRQTKELSYREILLCAKGIIASVYTFIMPEFSLLKRGYRIAEYIKFVKRFYFYSSGTLSVGQIHKLLKKELNLSDDSSYNYLCITAVVLSQLGYIQSKNNKKKLEIRNIDISGFGDTMRLAKRLHIIDLFKNSIIKLYKFLPEELRGIKFHLNVFLLLFINRKYSNIFFNLLKKIFFFISKKTPFFSGNSKYFLKCIGKIDSLIWINNNYNYLKGYFSKEKAFAGPKTVQIDITNACNLNCLVCWFNSPTQTQPSIEWKSKKIEFNKFKELVDFFFVSGVKKIVVLGDGEPFAHPEILNMVEYVKSKKIICHLYTNGTLLDKNKIDRLLDSNIDNLWVNIWAASSEEYTEIHPNQPAGAFTKLLENLKYFSDKKNQLNKKSQLNIINVIFNKNYKNISGMIDIAEKLSADFVEFQYADLSDKRMIYDLNKNELDDLAADIISIKNSCNIKFNFDYFYHQITDRINKLNNPDRQNNYHSLRQLPVNAVPCFYGWLYARVKVDGNVIPCCPCWHFPMGNIFKDSIKDIWHSEKWNQFRFHSCQSYNKHEEYFKNCNCINFCVHYPENLEFNEKMKLADNYLKILFNKN